MAKIPFQQYYAGRFTAAPLATIACLAALITQAMAAPNLHAATTSSVRVTVVRSQIRGITELRSQVTTQWMITFATSKPMHRVVRTGAVAQLYLAGAACPALSAVRTTPLARASAESAAFVSCSAAGDDAIMTFHIAQSQRIRLNPGTKSLEISVISERPLPARIAFQHGVRITTGFFKQDALSRALKLEQANSRQSLELLIETNRGTATASRAQTQLNGLPSPAKPVTLQQRAFSTSVNGEVISGMRIDVLGRGGVADSSRIFTRIYYYVYDPKTGALLMSGNQLAPNALAIKYGFVTNRISLNAKGAR